MGLMNRVSDQQDNWHAEIDDPTPNQAMRTMRHPKWPRALSRSDLFVRVLGASLSLAATIILISSCGAGDQQAGGIMIYVETGQGERGRRRNDDLRAIKSMVDRVRGEFGVSNKQVDVQVNYLEGDRIVDEVGYRHSLGLGPDIIISSMRNAIDLKRKGYTRSFETDKTEFDEINPVLRPDQDQIFILPAAVFPHVACFNSDEIDSPPSSRAELLNQSASGTRVGLTFETHNLFWLGAKEESRMIFRNLIQSPDRLERKSTEVEADLSQLSQFLESIRGIRLQKNITFYQNTRELDQAFQSGEVDWIPCRGPSLRSHSERLNDKLKISALPGNDPNSPAISMASQKVWSLGAHSNRRQRKSAERFVSLATSRAIQKDILLEVDSWFPINERVIIPTEQRRYYGPQQRSLERAFLIESTTQGAASEKADRISQIIQDVVYGFITPMSGAQKLLEIHD